MAKAHKIEKVNKTQEAKGIKAMKMVFAQSASQRILSQVVSYSYITVAQRGYKRIKEIVAQSNNNHKQGFVAIVDMLSFTLVIPNGFGMHKHLGRVLV